MENIEKTAGKTATESIGVTEMQIKKGFEQAQTWAEANKVIASMDIEQVIEMKEGLEITKRYSGLDMKQEFILNLLSYEIEERARKGSALQEEN